MTLFFQYGLTCDKVYTGICFNEAVEIESIYQPLHCVVQNFPFWKKCYQQNNQA